MAGAEQVCRDGRVDLSISPIGAHDDLALRTWFVLDQAAHAVDRPHDVPPLWPDHRARLSAPAAGFDPRAFLAYHDGSVVAVGVLELPAQDNLDTALVEIVVDPQHRRRGIGRAVLAFLVDIARTQGRVRLIGETHSPLGAGSPGLSFAAAIGARDAHVEVQRRLELRTLDDDHQPARPPSDLPLVQWIGDTPQQWWGDLAAMEETMSTDAPHGDLTWTKEVHDVARVQERDAMCRAREIVLLTTAAVASDGRLAAYSQLATFPAAPRYAHNWNTLVLPGHRGQRLGLGVKLANLDQLRRTRPSVEYLTTWNAASNTRMIAINDALGFRPVDELHECELDV